MLVLQALTPVLFANYVLVFLGLFASVFLLLVFLDDEEGRMSSSQHTHSGTQPRVSVLIPAYNEEEGIGKTIESILASDYPQDKLSILVVDDGSSDATAERTISYSDRGVSLIHKPNSGKAASINHGLMHISSELVLIVDADTYLEPDALPKMLDTLEGDSRLAACVPTVHISEGKTLLEAIQTVEYSIGNFLRKLFSSIGSFSQGGHDVF